MEFQASDIPLLAINTAVEGRNICPRGVTWIESNGEERRFQYIPIPGLAKKMPEAAVQAVGQAYDQDPRNHWFLHKRDNRVDMFRLRWDDADQHMNISKHMEEQLAHRQHAAHVLIGAMRGASTRKRMAPLMRTQ